MKNLIVILFWIICISLNATIYYVKPTGNDSNSGLSDDLAWKTWGKAFNETVGAGDTVYFRGGIYYKDVADGDDDWYYPARSANGTGYNITRDGVVGDSLYYLAYPGETPILDCKNVTPVANSNYGIRANGVNYVKFKGLVIRNVLMFDNNDQIFGWALNGTGTVVENCIIYRSQGHGFETNGGNPIYYINCDAYNIIDSLWAYPGERGTGFYSENVGDYTSEIYYINCRAWACSDQGFANHDIGYVEFNGCWAFDNGRLTSVGSGFKPGFAPHDAIPLALNRKFVNCVAAYNKRYGINLNDNLYPALSYNIYNTIAYKNVYGYAIYNTEDSDEEELARIFRNNIAFDNSSGAVFLTLNALYTHSNNSWDLSPSITLSDADFISVDSTGITAARQADGSLPDNDCYNYFLRPSSTFRGYQQGIDVGLTYDAVDSLWRTPPSIGFKEYYPITPATDPVLADISTYHPYWLTTTTASTGGFISDDGGGTVSVRGVCWNTTGTPTTADSKTEDGTGDGAFTSTMTGLTQGTTYYVRAYATNEAGTAYGSQMTFRTQIIKHLNKMMKVGSIFMIVN